MNNTTEELGEMLKDKAHKNLKADIAKQQLQHCVIRGNLSEKQIDRLKKSLDSKNPTIRTLRLQDDIQEALFDSNRESYEKTEVANFLRKVDQLEVEIEDLKSVQ